MAKHTFKIWRGDSSGGDFETYEEESDEGMVVLDVIHRVAGSLGNRLGQ